MPLTVNPQPIEGRWHIGFTLDVHTISSTYKGDNAYGHPEYDTNRTELGELLYRLKSGSDETVVPEVATAVVAFLGRYRRDFDVLVPVPPSNNRRARQPVSILATEIGRLLDCPVIDCVRKTKPMTQLKNVFGLEERNRLLAGLHDVAIGAVTDRRVLLFDDLYRSGATLNAVAGVLTDIGRAASVFAFAVTRTRSNR